MGTVSSVIDDLTGQNVHNVTAYGHGNFKMTPGTLNAIKHTASQVMQNGFLVTVDRKLTVVTYIIEAELVINGPNLTNQQVFDGSLGITNDSEIEILQKKNKNAQEFVDANFPAGKGALYLSERGPKAIDANRVLWKRPKDLTSQPQLVVDNVSKRDVIQGYLGDCWFLSACAAVTQNQQILDKVIPKGQMLYGPKYTGLLLFHFWRFGHWVNVCIDDQLPTVNGELVYARCSNANEFWVPLLEKAYAKLHGSYMALEGGQSKDALVDLTGGFAECYSLAGVDYEFYQQLQRAYSSGAFITCSRKGEWNHNHQTDRQGLVSGHAYTVTSVTTVPTRDGKRSHLLRVRNPWGDGNEWTGMWSDGSLKWAEVDSVVKNELEVVPKPDGEFWISFKDFCKEFVEVTVCTLNINGDSNKIKIINSAWEFGQSCGGSRNNIQSFATNPQFKLTLYNSNGILKQQATTDLWDRRNIVIALMQEHRKSSNRMGLRLAHISFCIYQVPNELNGRLNPQHFMFYPELTNSGSHTNYREVTLRMSLPPGSYVIIPSTYEQNMPRPFLLRIYCDTPFDVKELKGEHVFNWNRHARKRKPALVSIRI
ncbi:Calpain-like cysteine peptidase [Chamberlinius hualienensis]